MRPTMMNAAIAFFIAPVVFYLNLYYCFSVIPREDREFYPSGFARWFSWASLAIFTGMMGLLILARVFKVELF